MSIEPLPTPGDLLDERDAAAALSLKVATLRIPHARGGVSGPHPRQ